MASILDNSLFQTVSRQELSAQMKQLSDWVTGSQSDVFHGVVKRFSYLRQFSPVLLRTLDADRGEGGGRDRLSAFIPGASVLA